ncbi:hypothetical protein KR074_000067 [Drosophila pseudoananassae]|nr:hypothetical protein KR074_000067 [Drosophila pseudoananassae]
MIHYLFIIHLALLPLLVSGEPSDRSIFSVTAPWQVSIRIDGIPTCSGAVYSPLYILTAASCFYGYSISKITVLAGSNNRCWATPISTAKMIIHEKFEPVSKTNNLALLKLSEPLKLSRDIQEAPLAGIVPKVNSLAKVATWRKGLFLYHLSVIEEAIISKDKCLKALDGNALLAANETICAQNKILGACDKDKGAPLISRGQLAGILTYPSCSSKPDIYTSLVQYKNWLEANTE